MNHIFALEFIWWMFRWDILNLYLKHCSKNSWLQLYLKFPDMRAGDVSPFCTSYADSCYCTWQSSFPRGNHQTVCSSLGILHQFWYEQPNCNGNTLHPEAWNADAWLYRLQTSISITLLNRMFPVMCIALPYLPTLLCRCVDPRFDGLGRFFDSQHGFYASVTSYNRRPSWYMTFTTLHSATVTLNKNMDYCMNLIYSHLIIYWPTASCNVHFMSDFCYLNSSFCSLSKLLLIQNVRTKAYLIKKGSN